MVPIWVLSAPDGPHAGPNKISIRVSTCLLIIDYNSWPVYPDTNHKHLNPGITKDIWTSTLFTDMVSNVVVSISVWKTAVKSA